MKTINTLVALTYNELDVFPPQLLKEIVNEIVTLVQSGHPASEGLLEILHHCDVAEGTSVNMQLHTIGQMLKKVA